jgi:low temperature requirement protein LtrA
MATVKHQKVELIELFYDLIYVYAISRLTLLLEAPVGGVLPGVSLARYLVTGFVILQAWLYLTNYINRYSRWMWYDYALTAVNMAAAVYMANTISADWQRMAAPFSTTMLVMLGCVAALYAIQIRRAPARAGAAQNSLIILAVVLAIYAAARAAAFGGAGRLVLGLNVAAVLVGAFLPFFVRGRFDIGIISFPHLAERFELLTIITFGEGVVGMTGFFDVQHFTLRPLLVFAVLLSLFGSYVVQIHELANHDRVARALRLMFSHYFVVLSVNLVTVALKLLEYGGAQHRFVTLLMLAALALFYAAIFANSTYYHAGVHFGWRDAAASAALWVLGAVPMLCFDAVGALLGGTLFITAGNTALLLYKNSGRKRQRREMP